MIRISWIPFEKNIQLYLINKNNHIISHNNNTFQLKQCGQTEDGNNNNDIFSYNDTSPCGLSNIYVIYDHDFSSVTIHE